MWAYIYVFTIFKLPFELKYIFFVIEFKFPSGVVFHWHGAWYHQYADNTLLYISIPSQISDTLEVLTERMRH